MRSGIRGALVPGGKAAAAVVSPSVRFCVQWGIRPGSLASRLALQPSVRLDGTHRILLTDRFLSQSELHLLPKATNPPDAEECPILGEGYSL